MSTKTMKSLALLGMAGALAGPDAMLRGLNRAERWGRGAPKKDAGPLATPCPRCGADLDEECRKGTLGKHPYHKARVDARKADVSRIQAGLAQRMEGLTEENAVTVLDIVEGRAVAVGTVSIATLRQGRPCVAEGDAKDIRWATLGSAGAALVLGDGVVKVGQQVVVKKGARVTSMAPRYMETTASRAYSVIVRRVARSQITAGGPHSARVYWMGAEKCERGCSIKDVKTDGGA